MLRTFAAPFDFHQPRGGRSQFNEFAAKFASRFDVAPQVIDDPIFSYRKFGAMQLDRIAQLNARQPAIVYLSNVVMHSALLIIGDCETSDLQAPLEYDSLESFLDTPYVRGYEFDRDQLAQASFDDTTIVISDLARFRDDNDRLPDDGLFRVHMKVSDVFVCNILDYEKYFTQQFESGDVPFFLPANSHVDFEECARRYYAEYALRDYLLSNSISFATLGDDHMDDEYAVSYGMECWQQNNDHLVFVR